MALPKQHPSLLAMADAVQGGGDAGPQSAGEARAEDRGSDERDAGACGDSGAQGPRGVGQAQDVREDAARLLAVRYPTRPDLGAPRPEGSRPREIGAADAPVRQQIATHWRSALRKAEAVARLSGGGRGAHGAGMTREIDAALEPRLDWRTRLWRYLVRTPTDFSGFDRRFVHQGLYLDALESESLKVYVAVDTSGSIDDRELSEFLAEVRGVKRAYAFIDVELWFVDAEATGPYPVDALLEIPDPIGGGGTDFTPFFDAVAQTASPFEQALLVYLTAGDGGFPARAPEFETLWVVTEGGEDDFPFGQVARLADRYQRQASEAIP